MSHRTARPPIALVGALVACLLTARPSRAATPEEVDKAIKKAAEWLLKAQNERGNWEQAEARADPKDPKDKENSQPWNTKGGQWGGLTALSTYALLASGMGPEDPKLVPAMKFLKREQITGTYALAMRMQVWASIPPGNEIRQLMLRDASTMHKAQKAWNDASGGMFWYYDDPRSHNYDHSCSNYGVLGMWAAANFGFEVQRSFWELAEEGWHRNQLESGAWAYHAKEGEGHPAVMSMTTAGVATLFITQDYVHAMEGITCVSGRYDEHMARGMDWIAKNFKEFEKVHPYYTMYNIERVGVASGYKYFGDVNWYEFGADWLVARQNKKDGNWNGVTDTCFAMLFLIRGRAPVVMNKLDYTPPVASGKKPAMTWNHRPRDAANVTRWIGKQIERDLNWQITNLRAPIDELHDAPILYITGSKPLEFTAEEQSRLKQYILEGGLIVGHADCNKKEFADGFARLFEGLFPYKFRELPPEHPIYTEEQFRRSLWKTQPSLMGMSNGSRELVLLFANGDPARGWQTQSFTGPEREPAGQLMANIFLYAVDKQNLRFKGETFHAKKDEKKKPVHNIKVGRIEHAGNWDPEPAGWLRLAAVMHNDYQTNLEVAPVKLAANALAKDLKAVHLTGTEAIKLDAVQRTELKRYMDGGGTLIVDATGGNKEFALAAEAELQQVYPNAPLQVMAPNHPVYSAAGEIKEVGYRAFAQRKTGKTRLPRIRGLDVNKRTVAFLSPEDLSTGLVGQPVDGVLGYDPDSSTKLMAHMLLHAAGIKIAPASTQPAGANAAKVAAIAPFDLKPHVDKFAAGWTATNCGNAMEPGFREQLNGKQSVLVTHPLNPQTGCTLSRQQTVPAGRPVKLVLTVGHSPKGDWDLIVKVDGAEVKKETIGPATSTGGWKDVEVDLQPFGGKSVKIELINQPTGWNEEAAYWDEIRFKLN
jgi:hypothetical protein